MTLNEAYNHTIKKVPVTCPLCRDLFHKAMIEIVNDKSVENIERVLMKLRIDVRNQTILPLRDGWAQDVFTNQPTE